MPKLTTITHVRRHLERVAFAWCLLAVAFPAAWAAKPDPAALGARIKRAVDTEPTSPVLAHEKPLAVRDREAAIRNELAHHPVDPWVGDYFAYWLEVLVSRAGAVAITHGHLGNYGTNEGTVTQAADGSLRIAWNQPNSDKYTRFPVRLLPVRWGATLPPRAGSDRRFRRPDQQRLRAENAVRRLRIDC